MPPPPAPTAAASRAGCSAACARARARPRSWPPEGFAAPSLDWRSSPSPFRYPRWLRRGSSLLPRLPCRAAPPSLLAPRTPACIPAARSPVCTRGTLHTVNLCARRHLWRQRRRPPRLATRCASPQRPALSHCLRRCGHPCCWCTAAWNWRAETRPRAMRAARQQPRRRAASRRHCRWWRPAAAARTCAWLCCRWVAEGCSLARAQSRVPAVRTMPADCRQPELTATRACAVHAALRSGASQDCDAALSAPSGQPAPAQVRPH
jgi:hypothetical protein